MWCDRGSIKKRHLTWTLKWTLRTPTLTYEDAHPYSQPLNNMGLNCLGLFKCGFFSINIQLALCCCYLWVYHPQIQPTLDGNRYFGSTFGDLQVGRPDCIVVLHHFIEGTQASLGFAICGVLEPIPRGYRGKAVVKVLGSQKLYADFQLHKQLHCLRVNHIHIQPFFSSLYVYFWVYPQTFKKVITALLFAISPLFLPASLPLSLFLPPSLSLFPSFSPFISFSL